MIYFSEIKGRTVRTEDQIKVGQLEDLIFIAVERPNITKLVVTTQKHEKIIIPIKYLKKINGDFIIAKEYFTSKLSENELFLMRNLLDKQIIDLVGNKIVRVNDIALQDKDGFYVAGVDIGLLGILRWFNLESIYFRLVKIFPLKMASEFLSWADIQPLELTHGRVKLKKEEDKLAKLQPADLADHLEKTNIVNVKKILKLIDEKLAAQVISNLNFNYQISLFSQFTPEKAAKVICLIDADEAVDILLALSLKKRDEIIRLLPETKKNDILYLLSLSKTSIGGFISTEFLMVDSEDTAGQVIAEVKKKTTDFRMLNYIYVVNSKRELVGVFNLHELILQDWNTPVFRFMIQNVIVIHLSTSVEIVVKKMLKYKIYILPVIDKDKHLLGVVSIDDLAEELIPKMR